MKPHLRASCFFIVGCALLSLASAAPRTQNVVLIISDGLRWQEVFTGAEEALMSKDGGGVKNVAGLHKEFWRETPEARRETLMPFFWGTIAKHGQIYGNQGKGSLATVTNGKKFSYPGYNEILTGAPDARVDSNAKRPNPNITVFEWLNGRPAFRDKVSVFGTWNVFPWIFNVERSHLPIWPVWEMGQHTREIAVPAYLETMRRDLTPMWDDVTFDALLFHAVRDHLKEQKSRVLFVGFGETDEWAHAGRYDYYLTAAHHVDDFVRQLWETAQSLPEYRDKTTFILTADHGRGTGPLWKSHGEKVDGAEGDWIALLGPDTPPLGERTNCAPVTTSQIAATLACLLGEDFHAAFPQTGAPLREATAGQKTNH